MKITLSDDFVLLLTFYRTALETMYAISYHMYAPIGFLIAVVVAIAFSGAVGK